MKKGKTLVVLALIMMLSTAFVFAGGAAEEKDHILLGISAALSGDVGATGTDTLAAAQVVVDQFNKEGGILGKQIQIKYYDNKGTPDDALDVGTRLVHSDRADIVFSGAISDCVNAVMPVTKEAKVANFGTGLATQWLLDGEGMIFRGAIPNEVYFYAMAKYAYDELKARNVAVLSVDSLYGENATHIFVKWFESFGGNITDITTYTVGDRDFSSQAMTILSKKVDGIFVSPQPATVVPIVQQLAQFMGNKNIPIYIDACAQHQTVRDDLGDLANRLYINSHAAVISNPDPEVQKWIPLFQENIGRYGEIMARVGVGFTVMREAIKRAGTTEGIAVMKEVHKMRDVPTMMGPFTYDPRDGEGIKTAVILKPEGGADQTKDRVVFSATLNEPLYDRNVNYDRFFGKGYYDELLTFHGLK